jgi:hypothetical protein
MLCTFHKTIRNCVALVLVEGGLAIALADRAVELTDTQLNFYGRSVVLPPGQLHTPPASNAIIISVAVLPITVAANLVGRCFKFPITAIGLRPTHSMASAALIASRNCIGIVEACLQTGQFDSHLAHLPQGT